MYLFPAVHDLSIPRFMVLSPVLVWIPYHEAGLKTDGKVVGYSHNICATVVTEGLSCKWSPL